MRRFREMGLGGLVVVLMFLAACATKPQELERAEEIYQEAAAGEAGETAPAALRDAQEALRRAEEAYEEDGNTETTRALAYVAIRKSQQAMAQADINQLIAAREDKKKSLMERTERARQRTQEQLQEEKQQQELTLQELRNKQQELEETHRQLKRQRQEGEMAEEEFQRRQQELQDEIEQMRQRINRRAAAEAEAAEEAEDRMVQGQRGQPGQPGQQEEQEMEGEAPMPAEQEAQAKGQAAGKQLEQKLQGLADIALLESVETGVEMRMDGGSLFDEGGASLTSGGMQRLDRIASVLKGQSFAAITIMAYPADRQGQQGQVGQQAEEPGAGEMPPPAGEGEQQQPEADRQPMQRAEAVRQYMIKQGIPAAKIDAKVGTMPEGAGAEEAERAGQIEMVIKEADQ